jgi:hypothetical protein
MGYIPRDLLTGAGEMTFTLINAFDLEGGLNGVRMPIGALSH